MGGVDRVRLGSRLDQRSHLLVLVCESGILLVARSVFDIAQQLLIEAELSEGSAMENT